MRIPAWSTLVLNRPEGRNASSHEMMVELDAALDETELDEAVKAVVLREGKLFSSGHDLNEQLGSKPFHPHTFPHAIPSLPPLLPRAWYFRKPLIGAVHGYAGPMPSPSSPAAISISPPPASDSAEMSFVVPIPISTGCRSKSSCRWG